MTGFIKGMVLDRWRSRLSSSRLYAIVDTGYVAPERILSVTRDLVLGGADLIQLRAKNLVPEKIAELGRAMREIIPADGPLFILNDHPGLVAAMGANGVHVGQDDIPVKEARRLAGPNALVGQSTHSLGRRG